MYLYLERNKNSALALSVLFCHLGVVSKSISAAEIAPDKKRECLTCFSTFYFSITMKLAHAQQVCKRNWFFS